MGKLNIFIRSTMKDLQLERAAVERAISTFRFETLRAKSSPHKGHYAGNETGNGRITAKIVPA